MRFARDLRPGDLIVVSYNRTIRHAIFHGNGKTGNPHFYILPFYKNDVSAWKNGSIMGRLEDNKKPFKHYITSKGDDRIAKVDPSELDDQDRDAYFGIVNALKTKGIIQ